jgi:hypothetical protein
VISDLDCTSKIDEKYLLLQKLDHNFSKDSLKQDSKLLNAKSVEMVARQPFSPTENIKIDEKHEEMNGFGSSDSDICRDDQQKLDTFSPENEEAYLQMK